MSTKLLRGAKQGDVAWLVMVIGIVIYEFTADDLLSEATERYCKAHPWLTRIVIGAVAGHLACIVPPAIDLFSAKNIAHQWAVARLPFARPERLMKR